ncbi:MAG: lipase [Pseudomonadota bacterium]
MILHVFHKFGFFRPLATVVTGLWVIAAAAVPAQADSIITNVFKQFSTAPTELVVDQLASSKRHRGDVYLLRGFGNVFSRGLDQMGEKLNNRGIEAQVISHTNWRTALTAILANRKKFGRKPVVLIGHSLGANQAITIAAELKKRRIRVDYLVTFAATNPKPIPSNVRKVTNYYFETDGWGKPIVKGPGFKGRMKNIDFSKDEKVGHFNIEKQPRLQEQVIRNVLRFVRPAKKTSLTTPAGRGSTAAG